MTVDPAVIPGLLLLALELLTLAAVGYVVVRVALRQTDDRMALAQGLVIGPALWGLAASFILHAIPGRAGALAGWILVLAVAARLAWREREMLQLPVRTAAAFAAAWLALFSIVLAIRQTLSIPDADIHLGLASFIRAGGYPPTLPWNPGQPFAYHFGVDMLIGLLAPPFGPDLAFTTEVLSAYAWIGLLLVVATLVLQRGSWLIAMVLVPLLLTAGAWTLVATTPPAVLQIPVPAGIPAAGVRESLAGLYWPEISLPWPTRFDATPPNIWKPLFVMSYALSTVVLERVATADVRSWAGSLTLAAVIAFVGLLDEPIALVTLALWVLQDAWLVLRIGRARSFGNDTVRLAAMGPTLAVLLLVASGGGITDILFGTSQSGLSLGWLDTPGSRSPFGTLDARPGGIWVLGVGPVLVAFAAALLSIRTRLVLLLTVGSGVFFVSALALQYAPAPQDVTRFDGHARNLALLALIVALSERLARLRYRQRYAAATVVFIIVTWPTAAGPVLSLAQAIGRGVHLANTQPEMGEADSSLEGRYAVSRFGSEIVADYIRAQTLVDARILSPHPKAVTSATGRPNATGFSGLRHLHPKTGPEYADAIRYLEPTALRRLGIAYVHATDAWVGTLPTRAQRWLSDASLFEPLVRDGTDVLYRLQPAFLRLDPDPSDQSFEALRRAVPSSATVYLTEALHRLDNVRLASTLAHAQLYGEIDPTGIHLLTEIASEPLDERFPDIVLVPQGAVAFLYASIRGFPSKWREPVRIWQGHGLQAYAKRPSAVTNIDSTKPVRGAQFSVLVSEVHSTGNTVNFTATFTNRASQQWTGQDWLVLRVDDTPWALPIPVGSDRYTIYEGMQWYAGQILPTQQSGRFVYEFDPLRIRLAPQGPNGGATAFESSGSSLGPGVWALAVRLRYDNLQAAVIPLLTVRVFESGAVSYKAYEGQLTATVEPCPQQLQHAASCRRLAERSSATQAALGR